MKSSYTLKFIDQLDEINSFNTFENLKTIYHYSVPNTKLFYPEPFIASPSFMHSDLWFVHILLYQYWLWFVFIFIIVFFFITFLSTIRWCNMRVRPRRETRGVSRSKCGDLITATVPVSWATSIIVNESTDAIDYYDGFGTTELVVGIRAYQWGWEYYYPKDVDLNYNLKPNYSIFLGNSLKYNKTTDLNLGSNNLWKFYQNKNFDASVIPLVFLFSSFDNSKLTQFLNFNEIGLNPLFESNAFKKIKIFSKTFISNLVSVPSNYFFSYSNLNQNYLNNLQYLASYQYGSKKQHNFLSKFSLLNNQITFFSSKSLNKLLTFNYNNNLESSNNLSKLNLFANKTNVGNTQIFSKFLLKTISFRNIFNLFNLNTDKKQILDLNFKIFNPNAAKLAFFDNKNVFSFHHDSLSQEVSAYLSHFENTKLKQNVNFFKTNSFLISSGQSVSTGEKTIRNFIKIKPQTTPLNYSSSVSNLQTSLLNIFQKNISIDNFNIFTQNFGKNTQTPTIFKIGANKIAFDYSYAPVAVTKNFFELFNYDSAKNSILETPLILQGKEEFMPASALSAYWNFYFLNSGFDLKLSNLLEMNRRASFFYLPTLSLFYDYDFRNWQSSELLEDITWEAFYPLYTHFEHMELKQIFLKFLNFDKLENLFNINNRNEGLFNVLPYVNNFYTNFFFVDESFSNFQTLSTKNFAPLASSNFFVTTEESYESSKFFYSFLNTFNKNLFLPQFSILTNHSYSTTLDVFRSDYDDYSWFFDVKNMQNFFFNFQVNEIFFFYNNCIEYALSTDKFFRFNNSTNLRNTAKNSIVTYNAMQKVFKTRFDENRSHAKMSDLASSASEETFLTNNRVLYEKLLGKNKSTFFDVFFFKNSFKTLVNSAYSLETGLNFAFYDFPFLLALKSDSSRYLWFDWFAKWGYYEVQPSSSSRYAVFGMPYFSKNFEFSTSSNEFLNESENYLIRISRARRNYLPNWTYAPYLYLKNTIWFKQNIYFHLTNLFTDNSLTELYFYLNLSTWYWNNFILFNNTFSSFTPTNSNINSYARSAAQNNYSTHGYYYLLSNLADILTKREYLYRELFFNRNKVINLYSIFSNNPKNALFFEIKSVLSDVSPIVSNNDYSRDASYYALTTFKNQYFIDLLDSSFFSIFNKIFLNYFSDNNPSQSAFTSTIFKNQYRPMRKGVSNMIRLHATGAMALPTEIRLQVLASSKDVIHSWAIPSAGIKIDCVPGYSSHRVMIFLVSGIYWGQCMEICGRYHHWMPIIVYFMKRDLFFLWCTHFIHFNPNSSWNINDKQFADYSKPVSFDKSSWLLELNK